MPEASLNPSQIWLNPADHYLRSLKNPWYAAIARLQNCVTELSVAFWSARGGQTLYLPVTTGSISSPMGAGSDSLPVRITLEGIPTYLADSMQFMLEYGCRLVDRDCYYIMPSFRGESLDETHLSQFFHSEAEVQGDLDHAISVVEEYLSFLAGGLLEVAPDIIKLRRHDLSPIELLAEGYPFSRISFDEAVEVAGPGGIERHEGWRVLTRAGERTIMNRLGEFTWVTHWDHLAVPFYQAFEDDARRTARNADLLFGPGEVVGAGERHTRAEDVQAALALHGVGEASYRWYLEMREAVPMRTSGFGLGVERFLMWLLDHHDVRDFQLLPRQNGVDIIP